MKPLQIVLTVLTLIVSAGGARAAAPDVRKSDGYRRPQTFVDLAYPSDALAARLQGFVVIDIAIDDEGRVSATRVLKGAPLLAEPAAANARQWVFEPFAGRTAVVYRFDIDRALCNDESRSLFRLESPTLATVTACSAPRRGQVTSPRSGDDAPVLSWPRVTYPAIARSTMVQGTVIVQLVVSRDGTVASATPVAGTPLLVLGAVNGAKTWRFVRGAGHKTVVVYDFALRDSPTCDPFEYNEFVSSHYVRVIASTPCL